MRTYEIPTDPKLAGIIIAYEDGVVFSIPKDEANADYQAYLDRDKPKVEHLTEIPTNQVLRSAYGTYPARADRRAVTQQIPHQRVLGTAVQERQTAYPCTWSTPCLGNL